MMDTNIEWLFEEVYKLRKERREINFLSDWDGESTSSAEMENFIKRVYSSSAQQSEKYIFSYEQFELKSKVAHALNAANNLTLTDDSISITPSATVSLFLAIQSFAALGIKRVLVLTPSYFSVHQALARSSCHVFYHHLLDTDEFSLRTEEIQQKIDEQEIDCIVFSDPVYSAGIEVRECDYQQLIFVCQKKQVMLVLDYSLGGLEWERNDGFLTPGIKLHELAQLDRFLFVDSLSKRLSLNGLKFSIAIGDEKIIDQIDRLAEGVYGGLNRPQLELIHRVYGMTSMKLFQLERERTVAKLQSNYRLLTTALKNSPFALYPSNSGFFSVIYDKEKFLKNVDTKRWALNLLQQHQLLVLPSDRLSFYKENHLGCRINLYKPIESLLPVLAKFIGFNG
jgi:aspartate/methionine/tyrosine aminotransferase